jgi:hypothetical protein
MDTGAFRTPRTIIRPFSIEDAQKAFAWFGNPEVMKFTPSGLQETPCRMGRAKRNPSLPKKPVRNPNRSFPDPPNPWDKYPIADIDGTTIIGHGLIGAFRIVHGIAYSGLMGFASLYPSYADSSKDSAEGLTGMAQKAPLKSAPFGFRIDPGFAMPTPLA